MTDFVMPEVGQVWSHRDKDSRYKGMVVSTCYVSKVCALKCMVGHSGEVFDPPVQGGNFIPWETLNFVAVPDDAHPRAATSTTRCPDCNDGLRMPLMFGAPYPCTTCNGTGVING